VQELDRDRSDLDDIAAVVDDQVRIRDPVTRLTNSAS
jgi:hypothetical protein